MNKQMLNLLEGMPLEQARARVEKVTYKPPIEFPDNFPIGIIPVLHLVYLFYKRADKTVTYAISYDHYSRSTPKRMVPPHLK